jgi:hypothetical protein
MGTFRTKVQRVAAAPAFWWKRKTRARKNQINKEKEA